MMPKNESHKHPVPQLPRGKFYPSVCEGGKHSWEHFYFMLLSMYNISLNIYGKKSQTLYSVVFYWNSADALWGLKVSAVTRKRTLVITTVRMRGFAL